MASSTMRLRRMDDGTLFNEHSGEFVTVEDVNRRLCEYHLAVSDARDWGYDKGIREAAEWYTANIWRLRFMSAKAGAKRMLKLLNRLLVEVGCV